MPSTDSFLSINYNYRYQIIFFLSSHNHVLCNVQLKRQSLDQDKYAAGVEKLLLTEKEMSTAPVYVLSAYLFSPYTILSCAAQTTTVFANLCLAILYLSMLQGRQSLFPQVCRGTNLYTNEYLYGSRIFNNILKLLVLMTFMLKVNIPGI